ncbi:MAG: multidrug effflux MFS transporter [Capsulimonadaceae bacterium]|nr:multidrug effflux MFS transporter [Capsulimonadaceae bacterium]
MNVTISSSIDARVRQKYLGHKGLIAFLALLSAFVPLSTDLYLPALPTMTAYFHVRVYQTNLTLILFFIFFSLGMLLWGPLSDKWGRRPILLAGLALYAIASALCAASLNIEQLIFFRVLQALGTGAAGAVATAIVKDAYEGRKRESILALVQALVIIAPAVAPVVGALLLKFTSWRGVFVTQAILGIVVVAGSAAFQETLEASSDGNIAQTIGRLGVVLRNPGFTALLLIFSMSSITFMAFISSSSYIYQNVFHLSSQIYSYFFAFNAMGMLVGPAVYVVLATRFKRFSIINGCFAIMIFSGVLVSVLGRSSAWLFALALLPATIAGSCMRPPSTMLMLDQQEGDTGSASSLMGSVATVMGSAGMIVVSIGGINLVQTIGTLNIVFGLLCGGLWLLATTMPMLREARSV